MRLLFSMMIFFLVAGMNNVASAKPSFDQLANDLADKRIVFLDELTHGEKEVFKLKVDITKYLHEFHNFDAIVLESGMYDMAEIWNNKQSVLSQSQGNIFYMYANEPAFHPLLTYIDQNKNSKRPLVLAGFDGRLSGEISNNSLPTKLKDELTRWLPKVFQSMEWQKYQEILIATLQRNVAKFVSAQAWFEQQTVLLKDELFAIKTPHSGYDSPAYVAHLLDGLLIVANNLWGKRRFDEHDIAMANNLDWLLNTELKNKKVVVWGQFVHLNKHYYTTSKTDNVTSIIKKRYPNQTYVVHFAGLEGQYRNFISGKIEDIRNNEKSAEHWLWQQDKSDAAHKFYSPTQQQNLLSNNKQNLSFYGLQYKTQLPAHHWHLYWDGLFLLDKVSATR